MPEENKETGIVPEYPNNSNKSKEDRPRKEMPHVKMHERKRSILERFSNTVFGEGGTQSIGSIVLLDILIPAIRNTIYDMIVSALDIRLLGRTRGHRGGGDRDRTYHTSYDRMYRDEGGRGEDERRVRSSHRFDDIIIESKYEAEEIIGALCDIIDNEDVASVADFYNIVGITPEYTDDDWGWRNLRNAYVKRVRDGYVVVLPRPREIEEM